jgi:LPS-assembly lipoprotein
MRTLLRALAVAAAALALAGCGFKMRGAQTFPFDSVYVAQNNLLLNELSRSIAAGTNAKLVTEASAPAEARFILLGEAQEKVILALNTQGRVREYQLRYRVIFSVSGQKGFNYIPPSEIILTRDITFNDQVLAKENEEALLYRDMRSDAVQQIMRRIAASKPPSLEEE